MSRTPAMVMSTTFAVQPTGWALPADPSSIWGNFLLPMATIWSGVEASMESMLPQVDPRQAVELLPAFERMLGPDPCGRDLQANTFAEQQTLVYQRYTARGGQSIAYFVGLAASMGVTITIQESTWWRFGMKRFGKPYGSSPANQFDWLVNLPATIVYKFRFGKSVFGNRFGSFAGNIVSCPITRAAPAHTNLFFNYAGTEYQ